MRSICLNGKSLRNSNSIVFNKNSKVLGYISVQYFFKLFTVLPFIIISTFVHAQERAAMFSTYPEINENVQAFTNAFVQNLFPEIQNSEIKFDFSKDESGISKTNLGYGQISGSFYGLALEPKTKAPSELNMDFRLNISRTKPEGRPEKYALDFKVENGLITNSSAFTDFFVGILTPKCQEQELSTMNSILRKTCDAVLVPELSTSTGKIEKAFVLLSNWKSQMLQSLEKLEESEFLPIKTEFINYIDQKIVISKSATKITLSVNLSELVNTFYRNGRAFLMKDERINYSLQYLYVVMTESEIKFTTHIQKLHDIDSFNERFLSITVGSRKLIQDPQLGANMGAAIRQGDGMLSVLAQNADTLDLVSGITVGVWSQIFGTSNGDTNTTEKTESDKAFEDDFGL